MRRWLAGARQVESSARIVEIGGAALHWSEAGAQAARPLVLLHGLAGSHRWWRRNVPALSQRFRVLTPDLPGFGASAPFVERPSLDRFADAVVAWLDALDLAEAALVGHSMGAAIAALVALRQPERVRRLVLASPAVVIPLQVRGAPLRLTRRLMARGILAAWRESIRPAAFYPLVCSDTRRASQTWINQSARAIFAADVASRLAEVEQPALVLAGRRDSMIPLVVARAVARRLPRGRLVILQNAGHNLMFERAALFNRLVAEFVGQPHPPTPFLGREGGDSAASGAPVPPRRRGEGARG